MNKIILGLLALAIVSCGTTDRRAEMARQKISKSRAKYAPRIDSIIADRNYNEALIRIAEWRERDPGISKAPWLMMYEGRALIGIGNPEKAEKKFRKILSYGKNINPQYIALANYNLSYVYEIQGKDDKLIATLLSADNWSFALPVVMAKVEIPVRLASAYLRAGNRKESNRYFDLADEGILQIKKELIESARVNMSLADIYFSAGNLGDIELNARNIESYLIAFQRSQKYLLMAAESENEAWANQAEIEIKRIYEMFWNALDTLKYKGVQDDLAGKREMQNLRVEVAIRTNNALEQLKGMIVDDNQSQERLFGLIEFLNKYEKKLNAYILQRPVGEGLTESAKKFEKLKREGKIE